MAHFGYLQKHVEEYSDLSSCSSSATSNISDYTGEERNETIWSGLAGQSGANLTNMSCCTSSDQSLDQRSNNPTASFPTQSGYTNHGNHGNTTHTAPYLPGTAAYQVDYTSQMPNSYIPGNPGLQHTQTNYGNPTVPASGGFSFDRSDSMSTSQQSIFLMFNDFPTLISSQLNEFSGTRTVFGYAESVPHEDIGEPTSRPKQNFCVEYDCDRIKKAMDAMIRKEKVVVEVMAGRSVDQRVAIVQKYQSMYKEDLFARFKSITNGNLRECLVKLCYTPEEFDAVELRRAMRGVDTDEDTIIEILCSRTNEHIRRIKHVYPKLFNGRDLENDANNDITYEFKRICIALLQADRDEFLFVDANVVRNDAEELRRTMELTIGTDESRLIAIFATRSYAHLRAVFTEYKRIGKYTLEDALKFQMPGRTFFNVLLSMGK
ncbi:unnamed protein product [Schistosoma turkestanicum]|nr:unnamed protein product [Schistosoma turkestanicum]